MYKNQAKLQLVLFLYKKEAISQIKLDKDCCDSFQIFIAQRIGIMFHPEIFCSQYIPFLILIHPAEIETWSGQTDRHLD